MFVYLPQLRQAANVDNEMSLLRAEAKRYNYLHTVMARLCDSLPLVGSGKLLNLNRSKYLLYKKNSVADLSMDQTHLSARCRQPLLCPYSHLYFVHFFRFYLVSFPMHSTGVNRHGHFETKRNYFVFQVVCCEQFTVLHNLLSF
jgi:hypothetical protein